MNSIHVIIHTCANISEKQTARRQVHTIRRSGGDLRSKIACNPDTETSRNLPQERDFVLEEIHAVVI